VRSNRGETPTFSKRKTTELAKKRILFLLKDKRMYMGEKSPLGSKDART